MVRSRLAIERNGMVMDVPTQPRTATTVVTVRILRVSIRRPVHVRRCYAQRDRWVIQARLGTWARWVGPKVRAI